MKIMIDWSSRHLPISPLWRWRSRRIFWRYLKWVAKPHHSFALNEVSNLPDQRHGVQHHPLHVSRCEVGGLPDLQHEHQHWGPPGRGLPLPLLPVAAGHRNSSHQESLGTQGDGAVPGWSPDQQRSQEGSPAVSGNTTTNRLFWRFSTELSV